MLDAFEARPHGRLIRYDPKTDQATVLLEGLYFANGVALSRGDEFVLVNETWRYRTLRLWLNGPNAGKHLDEQGRVLDSVQPQAGSLYPGTLNNQWIARLPIVFAEGDNKPGNGSASPNP